MNYVNTHTDLVYGSKSPGTQNLDPLQLGLFEDAQLSLVGGRPAGREGLHQLTKHKPDTFSPFIPFDNSLRAKINQKKKHKTDSAAPPENP